MKVEVVDFEPQYREFFKNLNLEWLEKYFVIEDYDTIQLSNPETEILNKGGKIYFAKYLDKIVGTSSLYFVEPGVYELAKMAVTESAKGFGIGNVLMQHCINEARNLGAHKVMLVSNRSLTPAITMYEKFGFVEIPLTDQHYQRGNIQMELLLK